MKVFRSQIPTRVWPLAWGAWLTGTIGSFALLERAALRRYCHPTLSTTLRRTLGIYPRHAWGKFALTAFAMVWTWLVVHLAHTPDDVFFGPAAPREGSWIQVTPGLWYRTPRRRRLI